jgi:hypothetical protein
MRARAVALAFASLVACAVLFVLGCLGGLAFLANFNCGERFGYYGCDPSPTANNSTSPDPDDSRLKTWLGESDLRAARKLRDRRLGLRNRIHP